MPTLQTARIMWFALLVATVLFLVVLVIVKPTHDFAPMPMLLPVLAFAALSSAIASFVLPGMSLRQTAQRLEVPSKSETVSDPSRPASEILPTAAGPTLTRIVPVDPALARKKAMIAFTTPFVLSLALSETVAMFGFVLGFMGFRWLVVLPFFALSWILIALRFPTQERVIAPFERAKGLHIPRA